MALRKIGFLARTQDVAMPAVSMSEKLKITRNLYYVGNAMYKFVLGDLAAEERCGKMHTTQECQNAKEVMQ